MRHLFIVPALFCAALQTAQAQATSVGNGAPNAAASESFVSAYQRGNFSRLVILPPTSNVKALGSPGLIQTFSWVANTSLTAALVAPDTTGAATFQMFADLYTFYLTAGVGGVNIAGYPVNDTSACPAGNYGVCDYQVFSKDYALFVYSNPPGLSYSVSDPFYTEWNNGGGINGPLGAATSSATSVTSEAGTAGTQQLFAGGAIYSYTAGSATAVSTYTVADAIYSAFSGARATATLGFPVSEQTLLANGQYQQLFENGRILWTAGSTPTVLFPIAAIQIYVASATFTLNLGATATLNATVFDTQGNLATGRALTWSTSNGSAVAIVPNGYMVTLKAVGAGTANIQATGEGKVSAPITVTVIGQCCGIGDGAPTQTISQAFQAAAARNHLSVTLPNPTPVVPAGGGYIQTLTPAGGSGTIYVIAESSQSAIAYVIGGAIYAAYLANGGFSGPLGYPASDASPGGTQSFVNGSALAGSPVLLVPVPIAATWIASGAETGPLGEPAATAMAFSSIIGTNGNSQAFSCGAIYGITSGPNAGQGFISSGLILARYIALSGPAGLLGAPLSNIFTSGVASRQNFETGYIDLQAGASVAVEHYNPLNPSVTATPSTVAAGGTVHVAISGFAFGAILDVSMTGEGDFTVTVPGGVFGWNIVVPVTASTGSVSIQARSTSSGAVSTASGSYTIVPVAAERPSLTVISGDQQTGAPGAMLASPLVAVLADSGGNPLPGVPVSYAVSPGASAIVPAVTDATGRISASLRLQTSTGIALLSLSAAGQTRTFSALLAAQSIVGFPAAAQVNPQGGLTAALSAAILFYQNSGALASPNGLATPATLTQFLSANGGFTTSPTGAPIADPWIAMKFAGVAGGISVETPSLTRVVDLVNAGSPLVLEMSVTVDGAPGGGATVDAIGINTDGSVSIMDPNPVFGQTSLSAYLNGFSAQGHNIQGTLTGVIRIAPGLTAPEGFVSAAPVGSDESGTSAAGSCTNSIDFGDPAVASQAAAAKVGAVRFIECDGTQPIYQLAFGTQTGAAILDLASGPALQIPVNSVLAWQVTRNNGALAIAPQTVVITSVVNSAGFGAGISPGELFTIFGSGFTVGTVTPTVTVGGQPAPIVAAFPFQINARIPANFVVGSVVLQVSGPLGTVTQSISIQPAAPGIFAIVNQDGTLNTPSNPAQRGAYVLIFGTGLGVTVAQGSLQVTNATVSVLVGGATVKPYYAGLAPGFPGLYQINVQIPAATTPGASITMSLVESGQTSNAVTLAIQ